MKRSRLKKRALCLMLTVLLLTALLPPRTQAAATVYFTAVNDRMCELTDETMPFRQNGVLYVAGATVDGQDDLGIRYSYNSEKSIAILYKGQRLLYCDLTEGTMVNNRTNEYYADAPILRNGMVFFPINVLTGIFDLKYSITKISYGYLLRIRNEDAVLSDENFIDAAADPIQRRYQQYERAHAAGTDDEQDKLPTSQSGTYRSRTVSLLLPVSDEAVFSRTLSVLDAYSCHATFLLTPELAESAGDSVRRAAATGHAVALHISAETAVDALAQLDRGNDALWRAGNLRTRLVRLDSTDASVRQAMTEAGYCPLTVDAADFTSEAAHWAQTALDYADRRGSVRLYLGAEASLPLSLGSALNRLREEGCAFTALNEVTA